MFNEEQLKEFHLQKYYKGIIGNGNIIIYSIVCKYDIEYYFKLIVTFEKTVTGIEARNIPNGKIYYDEEHLVLKKLLINFNNKKRIEKINKIKKNLVN